MPQKICKTCGGTRAQHNRWVLGYIVNNHPFEAAPPNENTRGRGKWGR